MNSKLKKRLFFLVPFVIVVALLIAYINFGAQYFQKQKESQTPDPQILLQQRMLQKQPPDIEKLQSQLAEADIDIKTALASIPSPDKSMDIYERLLELDRISGAEVMSLYAGIPVIAKSGNTTTTILPYSLEVRGQMNDIMEFISLLLPGDTLFQGLKITSISLGKGKKSGDDIILSLQLEILTLSPSTNEEPAKTYLSGSIK